MEFEIQYYFKTIWKKVFFSITQTTDAFETYD